MAGLGVTLTELLDAVLESRCEDIWTCIPGKVEKSSQGFVDVRPMLRRPIEAVEGGLTDEELPVIPHVRILYLQAGPFALTFPVTPGVTGLLMVTTYSIAAWLANGEPNNPGDTRIHHLANCVFLPGLSVNGSMPTYVSDTDTVLESDNIRIGGGATSFVALATLVESELNAIAASITAGVDVTGTHGAPTTPYVPGTVAATKVKAE